MLIVGLLLLGMAGPMGVDAPEAVPTYHPRSTLAASPAAANELVEEYCTRCHSEQRRRGDLVLEGFDASAVADNEGNARVAEAMIRKLRAGMMPPAGVRRPEAAVLEALAEELEATLDDAWTKNPDPGSRMFQRLNRAEYASAVEDLLGIRVDVSTFLPLDTKSANFDNIADVQPRRRP